MKILLVGNCQARPVAEILQLASDRVEIIGKIIVHLAKDEDHLDHQALYESADVILAQQVASNYPISHVTTDHLKKLYPDKVVTWVNVFFHGQNPDLSYVTSHSGKRIVGPTDVYHSRALIKLWEQGVSSDAVKQEDYISAIFSADELQTRVDKSFSDLRVREQGVDIKMYDYIFENWKRIPLFHTFNHPNIGTVLELCDRVCKHVGLDLLDREHNEVVDRLSLVVPPMELSMATKLGMKFASTNEIHGVEVSDAYNAVTPGTRKIYGFADFVDIAFKCYDAQSSDFETVRYTPV